MNHPARLARWTRLTGACALLGTLVAGAAIPATGAFAASPGVRQSPAAVSAATGRLPVLDPAALRASIAGLPDGDVTGALLRVTGSAGAWTGTSGVGDLTTGAPVPADGHVRIGSVSKVFTAAVVLQLAAERRVDLDAPVQRYLPRVLPTGLKPMTVRQLLNHTSGMPRPAASPEFGDGSAEWFAVNRSASFTPQRVVDLVKGQPMAFEPGTAQQYNGINYFVAGMLVERVTGHSFAHEVRARLTGPLGLRDTQVPDAHDTRLPAPYSHGYLTVTGADGTPAPVDVSRQSPWPWSEGGMISTPSDLDRFLGALIGGRLLPPAQQAELFAVPDVPSYRNSQCRTATDAGRACMSAGLMRVKTEEGVVVWGKTGSRPGYTSGMFATRDLSRRVVYALNPRTLTGSEFRLIPAMVAAAFGTITPTAN
ncbi:serine hydrolase domain-containing protein [Streptomyces sp. NPDC001941]|uniref:serine hydrolase domain-containing protein n=1 Tax=Streptomyces sp. NPDC001941 TaxID=3154659 RepID=UPI0033222504